MLAMHTFHSLHIPRIISTSLHSRTLISSSSSPLSLLSSVPSWARSIRPFTTSKMSASAPTSTSTPASSGYKGRFNNPVIFVCDLQEKFRGPIHEFDKVILTTQKVLRAAQALSIPYLVTTQNATRLGPTVAELSPFLSHPLCRAQVDKTLFSMWLPSLTPYCLPPPSPPPADNGGVSSPSRTTEIILLGIESHICITQTALDALRSSADTKVYVLADAVSSCNKEEVPLALARLRAEGVIVTTSESWLYEAVGDAGRPEFKDIIKIVKDTVKDTQVTLGALAPLPLSGTGMPRI